MERERITSGNNTGEEENVGVWIDPHATWWVIKGVCS
jgi:hypothetical protein